MKCKIAIAHLEEVYQSDKFLQSPALGRRKTSFMANRHFSQKDRKCITLIQKTPVKYLIGNNHFCSLFSSSFFLSLSDTSNVSWMGHFVWSQPHSLHDFRFHANVLHFHAFKDQHSQKQGEKIISCNVLKILPPSYQHV